MKHLLIIVMFFIQVNGKNYCDGWKESYIEGWCYRDPNCIKPIVPPCPLPEVNFNTYQDGKNDGFLKGKKDRKEL
jgi:hypothetical protein